MNSDNSKQSQPTSDISGWWLVAAFAYFMSLNWIFISIYDYETIYLGPQVLMVLFVSYLPLIVIPFKFAISSVSNIKIIGISLYDFKRTLIYGIPAFLIAGLWQSGVFGYASIVYYPEWDTIPLTIGIIFLGIILPLMELKISRKYNLVPGLVSLSLWSIYTFYFPWGDDESFLNLLNATQKPLNYILIAFLISFFVPYAEEFYFRGFVLRYFTKRLSPFAAIVVVAFIFGLVHVHPALIISLTLFSIPLGMLTYYSKSIYPAVWAHVGLNLSASIGVWIYSQTNHIPIQ